MVWLLVIAQAVISPIAPTMSQEPPAAYAGYRSIIESYAAGNYATVDRFLQSLAKDPSPWKLEHLTKGILNAGPWWIRQGSAAERDRRRRVVAAVALEAANAGGLQDWREAKQLLEWACSQIRGIPQPGEAERLWQWGAIAVLEGAGDATALQAHVGHALKRFPGDPRFVLARGVAAELRTWPDPRNGETPRERNATAVGVTVARLKEALAYDDVRAEALLRIGFMALRNGDTAEALPYFREAMAAKPDPFITHLLHLYRGRALERLDRPQEAIGAYRAALAAQPGQTAQIALAAALARNGQRSDGIRLAGSALDGASMQKDPWIAYGSSDARLWPEIAARLRKAIQ